MCQEFISSNFLSHPLQGKGFNVGAGQFHFHQRHSPGLLGTPGLNLQRELREMGSLQSRAPGAINICSCQSGPLGSPPSPGRGEGGILASTGRCFWCTLASDLTPEMPSCMRWGNLDLVQALGQSRWQPGQLGFRVGFRTSYSCFPESILAGIELEGLHLGVIRMRVGSGRSHSEPGAEMLRSRLPGPAAWAPEFSVFVERGRGHPGGTVRPQGRTSGPPSSPLKAKTFLG